MPGGAVEWTPVCIIMWEEGSRVELGMLRPYGKRDLVSDMYIEG